MLSFRAVPLVYALGLLSCSPKPAASPESEKVRLSEQPPPAGYVMLRPVAVQSGKGCGLLAERGSREEADQKLRAMAEKLGASYVQIVGRKEPTVNHLCLEHEYRVSGVAYRAPLPAAPAATTVAAPPAPAAALAPPLPHVLLDFEKEDAPLGKPARSTERSSVALSLAPGESGGTALSVTYRCTGDEPQALLDVWYELGRVDFRQAKALKLRIKPDGPLSLSVSFMDANRTGFTQQPEPLKAGEWQTVELVLYKFWHNPHGPPGDKPGAAVDLSSVSALGLAPRVCASGQFLLDDVRLE